MRASVFRRAGVPAGTWLGQAGPAVNRRCAATGHRERGAHSDLDGADPEMLSPAENTNASAPTKVSHATRCCSFGTTGFATTTFPKAAFRLTYRASPVAGRDNNGVTCR